MNLKEKKLEIFYDHYKDSFAYQIIYLKRRNLYTLICVGIAVLLAIDVIDTEILSNVSEEVSKKYIGKINIDFLYINSALVFCFLWSSILYYQSIFLVEKMYKYIHELEDKLTKITNPLEIKREGKNYLENYPIISSLVHIIYAWVFPLIIVLVAVVKWLKEYNSFETPFKDVYFCFNSLCLLLVIISSFLYLSYIHFNDFRKNKVAVLQNAIKDALFNEKWDIEDDFSIGSGEVDLDIDLSAAKVTVEEQGLEKILVKVKIFKPSSLIDSFHLAIGQYLDYQSKLKEEGIDIKLYLAISEKTYNILMTEAFFQKRLEEYNVKQLIVNVESKKIVKWIE